MKKLLSILFICFFLAACGGGGSTDTVNPDTTSPDTTQPATQPDDADDSTDDSVENTTLPNDTDEPVDTGTTSQENLNDTLVQNPTSFVLVVFANNGQFLGVFNTNKYDTNSICNQYSSYGNKYSTTSIWNKFSLYGSDYSSLSAFSDYTTIPPILYALYDNGDLEAWYYVTTNDLKFPRIDTFELLAALQLDGCDIER